MKIIDQSSVGSTAIPSSKGAGPVDSSGRKEASRETSGDGNDSAELSGLADKISQALNKDSTARANRVEALRAEVASGAYQADAAATSRGIVSDSIVQAAGAGGSPKS